VILTRELDEAIRQYEIAGIRTGIETVRRLYPEAGAESIEVGGGLLAFTGVESPLTQAYGIARPVSDEEIAAITAFYETRGATPRVFVTPLADASLGRGLAAAGYAPCEYDNVMASDAFDAHALRDARIGIAADLGAWAHASTQAFMDVDALKPGDDRIASVLASSEGVWPLEAREDGAIVATAAMDLRGECAALFAGSTMPEFRNRGWHLALIRDRIARARDAGARFMRATAGPASASAHNFHRCGFVTLYTRAVWERKQSSRRKRY
jgi:GNAT superfamily N-acetyltransferase